jgi:hypothetical protein
MIYLAGDTSREDHVVRTSRVAADNTFGGRGRYTFVAMSGVNRA